MATLTTVFDAFVSKIQDTLSSLSPVPQFRVYAGPPDPNELREHIEAGISHVSVTVKGQGKRTAVPVVSPVLVDAPDVRIEAAAPVSQLQGGDVSTPASAYIDFTGTPSAGLNLLFSLNGSEYVPYHTDASAPSLNALVAALATAINAYPGTAALVVATAVGARLALTAQAVGAAGNAITFDMGVGGTGRMLSKVRQQVDSFDINIFTYDDPTRELIADAIDVALEEARFLTAGDEPPMRMLYLGRTQLDMEIRYGVYRRILHYTVEYNMTSSAEAYTVLKGLVSVLPPE